MAPLYMVASQLNVLMAEGIETSRVRKLKIRLAHSDWPETNMWWPQTRKPMTAMAMELIAMKRYPKMGFRLKTETTSLTIPIAGRIMM